MSIQIDLPKTNRQNYFLLDFHKKVIKEPEIMLVSNNFKVKYYKPNGFTIMDLFNISYHQNIADTIYVNEYDDEQENALVMNEQEFNDVLASLDYNDYYDDNLTLHGWNYNKATKIVRFIDST